MNGLTFNGIDDGVPTTGQIKFSDFFGKSLNIVVDCFSGGGDEFRINAKNNRWNNNDIVIIILALSQKKNLEQKLQLELIKNLVQIKVALIDVL